MTTTTVPASRFVSANGLRLHYLDWGNESAPALVCVHGYTGSAEGFNALARHFKDRFHVIAMDVRGHGQSEWSAEGAYQYADQAADLAALTDALGLQRFSLIGTSMGGIISMTYAGSHADRLERLVLNDIGPDVEIGSTRITQTVGARPDSFASLEEAIEFRRDASVLTARASQEEQRELALGILYQTDDGRWSWRLDPRYVTERVARGLPSRGDLWPVLASLQCPVLVVWGMESDVLSEAQAQRMLATLPRGRLVAVPETPHAPRLVEPAALAALDDFLS